jgi:heme/copper-type cytochrome/quinol oxidase subunit 2
MRALVRVVPQGEFNRWLGRQQLVEPQPGTASGPTTDAPSGDATSSASGT